MKISIKHKLRKWIKVLFSRMVTVGVLLALQLFILGMIILKFSQDFLYFYALFVLLSLAVVLWIINKKGNPAYKLAWIIPVLLFPIFGGLFYLTVGMNRMGKNAQKKMSGIYQEIWNTLSQDKNVLEELEQKDPSAANQARYIQRKAAFPVYKDTYSEYLTPGERKFERLKEELEKAEHYIFLEYFIIEEGTMWDSVLEILSRKVQEGVLVRLIYDDVGCLQTLPNRYSERMEKLGIHCCVFNPFIPVLSVSLNNRDHRKIVVIDGHTAFTGGINLADEYINAYEKHGHWKDASIMLKGEAVWSFTVMFLSMWDYLAGVSEDYEKFRPHWHHKQPFEGDGYVLPYGDSPLDGEAVGEMVYLNMINRAKKYVYICTPYLIIDNEMVTALTLAAKSGVDVRIITPHIPDKWYVHMMTRAYYAQLIEDGVRIYEYTPGFIHSKTFSCDDELAVVGTINLDYRSLYLHFECAAWLYQSHTVQDVKEDFLRTQELCQEITIEECMRVKWYTRLMRSIIRLFAPLM